jgi:hypothetical protein
MEWTPERDVHLIDSQAQNMSGFACIQTLLLRLLPDRKIFTFRLRFSASIPIKGKTNESKSGK